MIAIKNQDCIAGMKELEDNSVDSIVTDPPYELGFMGKSWDSTGIAYNIELWKECLRVLKPGGHLLSFGGTRTYHRMACAIEDAGFEIRDQIQWLYGSGFPKSMDISKAIDKSVGAEREITKTTKSGGYSRLMTANVEQGFRPNDYYADSGNNFTSNEAVTENAKKWNGWGTALKPANEPIVLARKPLSENTIAANVLKHSTGGLNIDACRIATKDKLIHGGKLTSLSGDERTGKAAGMFVGGAENTYKQNSLGRFPANIILDEEAGKILDEQSGTSKSTGGRIGKKSKSNVDIVPSGKFEAGDPGFGDIGGASRFFYCPKTSQSEREEGLEHRTRQNVNDGRKTSIDNAFQRGDTERLNIHPTVKPIALMEYLIKLITPENGTVLDPFLGSGSTGIAAVRLNRSFIGFELEKEYFEIAQSRINHYSKEKENTLSSFFK